MALLALMSATSCSDFLEAENKTAGGDKWILKHISGQKKDWSLSGHMPSFFKESGYGIKHQR